MVVFWFQVGELTAKSVLLFALVFAEGLILDALCSRFGIVGNKTHFPLILFVLLSALALPALSVAHLVYGGIWLAAFFLAFRSGEFPSRSKYYVIYFGVLLGLAQVVDSSSVLFLLPVFLLFIQTGVRSMRDFVLGILYFGMVVLAYIGLLYVAELEGNIVDLIPKFAVDYHAFDSIVVFLISPLVLFLLMHHWIKIGTYNFRYPNQSKILNFTLLIQWVIASLIILVSADPSFMLYLVMPVSVMLSFAMSYNTTKVFMNAAFFSLLVVCVGALFMYRILFL